MDNDNDLGGELYESDDDPIVRSEFDDFESRIEQMEGRIKELEEGNETARNSGAAVYVLGTAIAVVLSWSRNASILWCILHGIFSWFYVVYFAFTR
jgi:hypothetical protein